MAKASASMETVSSKPVHLDDAASHQGFPPGLGWWALKAGPASSSQPMLGRVPTGYWFQIVQPGRPFTLIPGIVSDSIVAGRTSLFDRRERHMASKLDGVFGWLRAAENQERMTGLALEN